MTTGMRTNKVNSLVRSVLGDARYEAMSKCHIRIEFDASVLPYGQFIGRVRFQRPGCAHAAKTIYGSGTRVRCDTEEAQRSAIWRVYSSYVQPEIYATECTSPVLRMATADDDFSCSDLFSSESEATASDIDDVVPEARNNFNPISCLACQVMGVVRNCKF